MKNKLYRATFSTSRRKYHIKLLVTERFKAENLEAAKKKARAMSHRTTRNLIEVVELED